MNPIEKFACAFYGVDVITPATRALHHLETWYGRFVKREDCPERYLRWTTLGLIYHDRCLNKEFETRGFPLDNKKPAES